MPAYLHERGFGVVTEHHYLVEGVSWLAHLSVGMVQSPPARTTPPPPLPHPAPTWSPSLHAAGGVGPLNYLCQPCLARLLIKDG